MFFFKFLDKIRFLNIRVWDFSINSLIRNYGIAFIYRVIIKHPVKTITGIKKYQKINKTKELSDKIMINPQHSEKCIGKDKSITGVGFCLKPLKPECISGRANHDCKFFEHNLHLKKKCRTIVLQRLYDQKDRFDGFIC